MKPAFFLLSLACFALPARAQISEDSANTERERALEIAVRALEAFRTGDAAGAVQLLREAREVFPEPQLLYNLGRAYDALGDESAALDAYVGYIEERPDAPDRAAVEARIGSLRNAIAERERIARERDEERRRREAEEARRREAEEQRAATPVAWVMTAVGAASLAVGATVGVLALRRRQEAIDDPVHVTTFETFDEAKRLSHAATGLYIAGGVIAGAGLLWGIIGAVRRNDADQPVDVSIGPGGVSLRGTF